MSPCENDHIRPATSAETAAALEAHFCRPNDSSSDAPSLSDQERLKRAEHFALIGGGHTLKVFIVPNGNDGTKPLITYEKGFLIKPEF